MGNTAHLGGKWKEKLEIYLKATGASKKPDEMKVGLLLNHMCDSCLKIYSNFVPSVTILREEKRNRRPKILRSTQLC